MAPANLDGKKVGEKRFLVIHFMERKEDQMEVLPFRNEDKDKLGNFMHLFEIIIDISAKIGKRRRLVRYARAG